MQFGIAHDVMVPEGQTIHDVREELESFRETALTAGGTFFIKGENSCCTYVASKVMAIQVDDWQM